jgi:hypothetical protein
LVHTGTLPSPSNILVCPLVFYCRRLNSSINMNKRGLLVSGLKAPINPHKRLSSLSGSPPTSPRPSQQPNLPSFAPNNSPTTLLSSKDTSTPPAGARGASSAATFECLPSSSAPTPSPTLKSSETPKSHLLPPFLSALLYLPTLTESANTADANGQSLLLPPPPLMCPTGDDNKFGEDPNHSSASNANHPNRFMSDEGTQAESKVRGAGVERSENA